jgi:ribose 1,5-bisphosphokinase PhnN
MLCECLLHSTCAGSAVAPPRPGEEYTVPKMIANLSDNGPQGLLNVSRACLDFLRRANEL